MSLLENLSMGFLLINLSYFFLFKSTGIINFGYENISPLSFLLGVVLSRRIYKLKKFLIHKNNSDDIKNKIFDENITSIKIDKKVETISIETKDKDTMTDEIKEDIKTNIKESLPNNLDFENSLIDDEIIKLTSQIDNIDNKLENIYNQLVTPNTTPNSDILDSVLSNILDEELDNQFRNIKDGNKLLNSVSSLTDEIVSDYLQPLAENKKEK